MGAATQPTDFSDLYTDLMNRVRADTTVTATSNQAKRYINTGLMDMHIGTAEKVPWAERDAYLVTQPQYTTGTIAVSIGGTTLTGTGTAWNTNNDFSVANMRVGGKIVINGGPEVYQISAVASDTSSTISAAFVGATVTAATYVYFEDEYALAADFLRPLDWQNFDTRGEIELVDRQVFRMRHPRNSTPGKPRIGTIVDRAFSGSTTPVRKIRLAQPTDQAYLLPYAYITGNLAVTSAGTAQTQLISDTDEPIVPLILRHGIILHALKNWYRDKRDDARAQSVGAEYVDFMIRMTGDQEVGSKRPRIQPRRSPYLARARSPYRGTIGRSRYVVGDAFDERR